MSSVKYTSEQIKAITKTGTNLLVSASAGSGKTTVLIERILYKIKNLNLNVDELLIVTYTEAAAQELKQRLRIKLNKELLNDSNNQHLRMQLPRLANAQISTFHSFCNSVIKKFFYLIDFDAMYKISDDIENFMIASECLEKLFNELYQVGDEGFMLLVNRFTTTTNDDNLRKIIIELFTKMRSLPFKDAFREEALKKYEINKDLNSWELYSSVKDNLKKKLDEAESYFKKARDLALIFEHNYAQLYNEDMDILTEAKNRLNAGFDSLSSYFKIIKFPTFSSKCNGDIDDLSKEMIKDFRDMGKVVIKEITKCYLSFSERSQIKFIVENYKVLNSLFEIIKRFEILFSKAKRDKNLVDFSDLEETTLKILTLNNGKNEATEYYKELFKEILIDEFQDTNSMQETIIKTVSNNNNIFMVGDVKQSIYRFRNSEPEIFQSKYKDFSKKNAGELINLNANYRSRKEILDYINFLFYQLMDEEVGEITYDEAASLVFGQINYNEAAVSESLVSLHLLEKDKINEQRTEKLSKTELEVHYIAQKIRQLVDNKSLVYDSNINGLRNIKYKDIVILSRTKSDQDIYNEIFKKYNIPFLTSELSGYFNSIEVLTITSLLKIIDNPLQDISLVASLRTPIFKVTEKELVEIKINSSSDYYYEKAIDYLKIGTDELLINKLKYFNETLIKWREKAKHDSLSELIYQIYHETNYYEFVLGQLGGAQRQANLDLLYDKAKLYENLTQNSLFRFIQLINFLNENDKDLPQARTVSDNEDLVRFMSIHKSKGLEFPVVFITNLNKKYNIKDELSPILFDKELGIAFSYLDLKYKVKYDTLYQSIIKSKMRKQLLAEEMRLLYVALTRAKERLFLIGTIDDFDKEAKNLTQVASYDDLVIPVHEKQATNYLNLILKGMSRHHNFSKLLNCEGNLNFKKSMSTMPNCDIFLVKELDEIIPLVKVSGDFESDFKKYSHEISERINFKYPNIDKTTHFAKQTIADMKRANQYAQYNYSHEQLILKTPKFIDLNKASAMMRGTCFHMFMQHIDYRKKYTELELVNLKTDLINKEIFNELQASLIDVSKVYQLLQTDLIKEISRAKKIDKELPFTTIVSSKDVYQDLHGEIDILVQGVMDLFVLFDHNAYLIDFKTDRIKDDEVELERIKKQYQIQMNVYKDTLKNIYPSYIIKAYLYLFEINKFVEV